MAKKNQITSFKEAKQRLLTITQKIETFWKNGKKTEFRKLAIALDVFVDTVNIAENLATQKSEKDIIKQIRSFFIPEQELAVIMMLILKGPIKDREEIENPEILEILDKYTGPGVIEKREVELKDSLKKIEAILLQE